MLIAHGSFLTLIEFMEHSAHIFQLAKDSHYFFSCILFSGQQSVMQSLWIKGQNPVAQHTKPSVQVIPQVRRAAYDFVIR